MRCDSSVLVVSRIRFLEGKFRLCGSGFEPATLLAWEAFKSKHATATWGLASSLYR